MTSELCREAASCAARVGIVSSTLGVGEKLVDSDWGDQRPSTGGTGQISKRPLYLLAVCVRILEVLGERRPLAQSVLSLVAGEPGNGPAHVLAEIEVGRWRELVLLVRCEAHL